MILGGTITILRIVIGLILIILSVALMACGAGAFMALPGIITFLVFMNLSDMSVLANFWGWDEKSVMSLLLFGGVGSLVLAGFELGFLANIIGGLSGIIAGILTMGIFGSGAADALLQIVSLPMLGLAAVLLIFVLILSGF